MEQSLSKIQKDIFRLKCYAVAVTVAMVIAIAFSFYHHDFKEITVQRINVKESNGKMRMVISNKERSPEVLTYGKPYNPPIPGHERPGIIFYNDEGTENGGLVFMGHTDSTGKYLATGHLSFDQYNQNQVLYLQYADENGQRSTGLHIDDWQQHPAFWQFRAKFKEAQKLPSGPEKDKILKQLMEPKPGQKAFAQRVLWEKTNRKQRQLYLPTGTATHGYSFRLILMVHQV